MTAILFEDDEAYHAWLRANPKGFVLNVRKSPTPSYMVLHCAVCHSISIGQRNGAFTENAYRKVCAGSISELRTWARQHDSMNGEFSRHCQTCSPMGRR